MAVEKIETLVVGGGQAGLAMSEHLSSCNVPHIVLERARIAERWRTERWDSLVANGPAWHDRFPTMEFSNVAGDAFAPKAAMAQYFEEFAAQIKAPIRCGVDVLSVQKNGDGAGFRVETSQGVIEANNVVAATGPFQRPVIPQIVPQNSGITQIHSNAYRNPDQLPEGGVLVVGAGASGAQIADELLRAGRRVYLSVGPHDRPPRRYRGKDFVWWLRELGKWDAETAGPSTEHVTISVSGARGGHTVDFRQLAARGMTLVGRAENFADGVMSFASDVKKNVDNGDANYLSLLDEADAHVAAKGIDLPVESDARNIGPDPECITDPIRDLNLAQSGVNSIVWATGFTTDFKWLDVDAFDGDGKPMHDRGVSRVPGIYFLGLPWLSRRGSSFIWGVWPDAQYLAGHISTRA